MFILLSVAIAPGLALFSFFIYAIKWQQNLEKHCYSHLSMAQF